MKRLPTVLATMATLVACTPTMAQEDPGTPRPHVYEVAPEHEALLEALRQQQEAGFLEVSGSGRVSVPADRARVVFAVETEGPTAEEASSANAELMTSVLEAVRATGAPGLTIETHGYTLQPEYARPTAQDRSPSISGYRAQNHVAATTSDGDGVGRIIDAAVGAGANRVASLVFEASDTEEARQEALRMAVAQARAQAETMAAALGVPLGPPMEVRGNANVPGPPPRVMAMRVEAANTPIEAGAQMVTANVTIRYALGN